MRKYLHKFENLAEFESAYNGSDYHEPWVSLTKEGGPTKISCYDGDSNYPFIYREQAPINGEGNYYIWENKNNGTLYGSESRNIKAGDEIVDIKVGESGYDWASDHIQIQSVTILESINPVSYNKRPFDGDLIVDYGQRSDGNYCRVIWSNPNLAISEEVVDYGNYNYLLDSSSILNTDGNGSHTCVTLKVRVINYEGKTIDFDTECCGDYGSMETSSTGSWHDNAEHDFYLSARYDVSTNKVNMYVWIGTGE